MSEKQQTSMLSFAKDLPNICSLLGLLSAVLGIYFAIEGNFPAAIIGVLWSVLFDWYDGIIARKMKGRTKEQGVFGAQLDSMIDIVSFGHTFYFFHLYHGIIECFVILCPFLLQQRQTFQIDFPVDNLTRWLSLKRLAALFLLDVAAAGVHVEVFDLGKLLISRSQTILQN